MNIMHVNRGVENQLELTVRTLESRGLHVPVEVSRELEETSAHLRAVAYFANQMKSGSSIETHPVDVLNWLIEQGWTPPAGVYLMEEVVDE